MNSPVEARNYGAYARRLMAQVRRAADEKLAVLRTFGPVKPGVEERVAQLERQVAEMRGPSAGFGFEAVPADDVNRSSEATRRLLAQSELAKGCHCGAPEHCREHGCLSAR